jgi:g-D-glutamyl-meso-diaminopimelate peptidase
MRITVRSGDTFWRYSQLFRVPLYLIEDSNPGVNPLNLVPGATVEIPGYVTAEHRVVQGDSLWQIARNRGIPLETLFLLNPDINPNALQIGQIIRVPVRVTWPVVQAQQPQRPYDSNALAADLNRLTNVYPFIRRRSIGTSVLGKDIAELRIGRGSKRVHVNGAFHANEWITSPLLVRFLNEYALALTVGGTIRGLVMEPYYLNAMLSAVPMVNPDGVDLVINGPPEQQPYRDRVREINGGSDDFSGWKANIRGVDLNDQFPALWELEVARSPQKQPAPRDYPGTAPLTEPEAVAMAQLTRESDFARVLAFHTQGEVIYWGFQNLEPPESERLVNEFARVSGYVPIRNIESYAGYKDWFIQDWRRPGFTIEAGRGVNPLPLSQFEEMYQKCLGILLASLYA